MSQLYYLQSRYYNPEIGRFISADTYVSTGQGILGHNMFVYCANNPVQYIDPTGELFVNDDKYLFGLAGGGGAELLSASIIGTGVIVEAVENLWEKFVDITTTKLQNKADRQYRTQTETHHIAAKGSFKAADAQAVLKIVFPGKDVEAVENKVPLATKVHKVIHTDLYYAATNLAIVAAYEAAEGDLDQARKNVINTLDTIRGILLLINELGNRG